MTARPTAPAHYLGILSRLQTRLGAAACSFAELAGDGLRYLAATGPGADELIGTILPVDEGLGGWVAQSEQAIIVDDAGSDARFARAVAESTGYVPRSLLIVPVFAATELAGILTVLDRDEQRAEASRDVDIATVFAEELGGTRPVWSAAFEPLPRAATGQLPVDGDWAFGGADGTGVTVAVVDSGVDFTHPDVAGPSAAGAVVDWSEGRPPDVQEGPHPDLVGHGTACAAIVRRLAPGARLRSVRVLGPRLSTRGEVFAAGLQWAIDSGARVVNLSLSSASPAMRDRLSELADRAAQADVLLVCAMNNSPAPSYPSSFSTVVSVAACRGERSWGPWALVANPRPPADFATPGLDVDVAWEGGRRIRASGNSFAAPVISGLAARLFAAHPHLTSYQAKAVLRSVAVNGPEPAGRPS